MLIWAPKSADPIPIRYRDFCDRWYRLIGWFTDRSIDRSYPDFNSLLHKSKKMGAPVPPPWFSHIYRISGLLTHVTVEALYLQGFHRNVIKNLFLRHHASVAWRELRGQGRASGGCAWAQNDQLDKLYNSSSSTASWNPFLSSESTSWHWRMTSQKPTFDNISMEPLLVECCQKLGLFGTLKLVLALQFIVMNAYFSVARMLTLVLHATLK